MLQACGLEVSPPISIASIAFLSFSIAFAFYFNSFYSFPKGFNSFCILFQWFLSVYDILKSPPHVKSYRKPKESYESYRIQASLIGCRACGLEVSHPISIASVAFFRFSIALAFYFNSFYSFPQVFYSFCILF